MEVELKSSIHLDFLTLWQSVDYMETYLRRRRKAEILSCIVREKSDKMMVKDEPQRPETHPATPATVRRPRFSNIEDMLHKPLAVVKVPRIHKGNREGSPLRVSTAGTIGEVPNYDLPRLRPVHVEVREIPLPTQVREIPLPSHIQQMTILSFADRRPKYLGHSPRNNDRNHNGNSTFRSGSKLPQISFPRTDYHKNPTARELTDKKKEKIPQWVSDSVKRQFMYSKGFTDWKEKKPSGRKLEKKSPNCCNEVILKYGGQNGKPNGKSSCTFTGTVRYVGDVKLRSYSKDTLQLVAKQQPIHPVVKPNNALVFTNTKEKYNK